MEFEACIESLEGAKLAAKYGADRLELCAALHEGGISPSSALVKQVMQAVDLDVFAMIRPLAGGFQYSEEQIDLLALDIEEMAGIGVKGVVFGILNERLGIDLQANKRLVDMAHRYNMIPVCHRAFDFTPEPLSALDQLIDLGFYRLLTSGQQAKAIDGLDLIRELKEKSKGRIEIMAGSGVAPQNMPAFSKSGIDAVHFTVGSFESTRPFGMGARLISDEAKVRKIMAFKK
ncbi:MAG: copper homeostasis protein CutC [Bacteroidetes bacterium]|nr:copper homeostasis protein CutC [Bacteroidota bacterium]